MIPVRLSMRNFMPYKDTQVLDFSGIHTASICGDNGSGKSSIIDAITWALWGETRAKRDDDLIHQNEPEAEVDFEFAVSGQKYRVLRRHARPKKRTVSGQSLVHFYIADESGYRALDGDNSTMTGRKIEQVLHMDYDTFVNSAYLKQGHADEFTTANPSRRKQVLSSILGLSLYDELSERARDAAALRKTAKDQLELNLTEIDAELAHLPECETDLSSAQDNLLQIEQDAKTTDAALQTLRQSREELTAKQFAFNQLESGIVQKSRTVSQLGSQVQQLRTRITQHEAVVARRQEIEAGFAGFVSAREQNDLLNQKLAQLTRLNEKKHALEMSIAAQSQELNREHARIEGRHKELERIISILPQLREEKAGLQSDIQEIDQKEVKLGDRKQQAQEMLTSLRAAEADKTRLLREIEEIKEKVHLLKTEKGASCPLCGCQLGAGGFEHIEGEFAAQSLAKSESVKTLQIELQEKQLALKRLAEGISLEERTLAQQRAGTLGRSGAVTKEIERAEEASREIAAQSGRLTEIEAQLVGRSFAVAENAQLQQVEAGIAGIGYDSGNHDAVRRSVEAAKKYEMPKQQLDEAVRLLEQEHSTLLQNESLLHELEKEIAADTAQKLELSQAISGLPSVTAAVTRLEVEQKTLALRQKQAQEQLGAIKGRLESMSLLKVKKEEKTVQFRHAASEEQVYRDLTEAFGKKGVQSLIIETALPEIENEANSLLARMTDNRMNVKFETQRETQKGDVLETLDIKIADELGTRAYELFSGGEAFRINFAVRIALSRLLARRAGAPLPTLIIDEGFGTQDTVGIEKLREAITAIQDDFEKVLVITHIEELRDAFPARIDVVKEPDGSKISLS